MRRLRKISIGVLITLVALLVLVILFVSPITKWAIEKYSPKYVGRQITMDGLSINIFTGSITSKGFKLFEKDGKNIFFKANELYANINVHKVLSSEYDFTEIKINKPEVSIIQKGKHFNYSDLVKRFYDTSDIAEKKDDKPLHYSIKNFHIDSAIVTYINTSPYNKIQITHASVAIPVIAWDEKKTDVKAALDIATGGKIDTKMHFDRGTHLYNVALDINRFNIEPFYCYLKDYMKVNSLKGLLSTSFKMNGNAKNPSAIAASGNIWAEDFSIIDNTNDKLTAAKRIDVKIDSINTAQNMYKLNSVSLNEPFLKLAMYDKGFNFDRLMTSPTVAGVDTSSIVYSNPFKLAANYIQEIVGDYIVSNYSANKIEVTGGKFIFIDYTLPDKFQYDFDSLHVLSDRINNNNTRIYAELSSLLNSTGSVKANISINPKDFKEFDMECSVRNILTSDFNPYMRYYVATPFTKGVIVYTNKTTVAQEKHLLNSTNDISINQIIAGKKDKTIKPQYNMPIRLAVALLRDVHGDVKLNIPVKGSLDDPKFKWGKIVWQILGNLIVKAATSPFHLLANMFGGKEEDYKELQFDYMQTNLTEAQQKQLSALAKVLKQKPDLKVKLTQYNNVQDEMEILSLLDAKRKYLHIDSLTTDGLQKIDAIDNKDSLFNRFLDSCVNKDGKYILSVQEKAVRLFGKEKLEQSVTSYMQQRNAAVSKYLMQQQIPQQQFTIKDAPQIDAGSQHNPPKYSIDMLADDEPDVSKKKADK
jgi:hypothetical protein